MSRVAAGLSLVAGGGNRASFEQPISERDGERRRLPASERPTLSELFAASPRDGGATGFLLAQLPRGKPLLWIQERMAILEAGRIYPPGLGAIELIHVEARDARDALWAMEEGLRCSGLGAVIGEIWGDPRALDFTATRRLAVAAERSGVAAWLVRLGGLANLSGARMRWRVASAPSPPNELNARAPGAASWDAELFRARGAVRTNHLGKGSFASAAPGRWVTHDGAAHPVAMAAAAGDRALGEERRSA